MLKKEVLQLLGRQGKMLAGNYYRTNENTSQYKTDWFSGGFNRLVTDSVNHALITLGKSERVELLSSNTANAVGSAIDD